MGIMKRITVLVVLFSFFLSGLGDEWCQRTTKPDLCTSIVEADPRADLKNTPNGLCMILRDRAVSVGLNTKAKISKALEETSQVYAHQCLQDCFDSYERIIPELANVDFTVMNHQNYLGLGVTISGETTEVISCDDCFTERPGTLPSPITTENSNLHGVLDAIQEIINLNECDKIEGCN